MILAAQLTNTEAMQKKVRQFPVHFYKDIWQKLANGVCLPGNIADFSQL